MKQKLTKSNSDKILFGVCGGIAEYLSIDSSLIRICFFLGTFLTGSLLFWIYILLVLFMPKDHK